MLNWCDGLVFSFCRLIWEVQLHQNFSFVLPFTWGDLEATRQIERIWQIRFERCCSSVLLHTLLLRVYLDGITYKQQCSAKQLPPPDRAAISQPYCQQGLRLWNGSLFVELSASTEWIYNNLTSHPVHFRRAVAAVLRDLCTAHAPKTFNLIKIEMGGCYLRNFSNNGHWLD